jgi:hypothetical protein
MNVQNAWAFVSSLRRIPLVLARWQEHAESPDAPETDIGGQHEESPVTDID